MKKRWLTPLCGIGAVLVTAAFCVSALCACAPADDIDYELFGPDGFLQRKFVYFDNLSRLQATNNDENIDARIYDYQRGGAEGPVFGLSAEHDHTADLIGAAAGIRGKSFWWANRTSNAQRVKFDSMFTPSDIGSTFYISLWVWSDRPAKVRLGAFSLSGRLKETLWATSPREHSPDILIDTGWNEVVWAGYVHKDFEVTQLGFEQVAGTKVLPANKYYQDFYIDDIVFWAR
jgi:hypothetical protein